jgi:hypothetical protein
MEKFRTELLRGGKTATGIEVPAAIVEALGGGKRPKVAVTINGYAYRNSIAVMGGKYMLSVASDIRAAARVEGGDMVEITLELDTAPREVDIPPDFASALAATPAAKSFFDSLAYSHQLRHVLAINDAKTAETRQRRISKAIEMLREGKK